MPVAYLYAIASVVAVSLVSLIGVVAISISEQRLQPMLFVLVSLAALAIIGAMVALFAGSSIAGFAGSVLPVAAGAFIYIAGSDLLPELQKESGLYKSIVQLCALAAGAGLMLLLTLLE
jgi:zinc and cadmium transporter